jgi:hypothetical protein
MARIIRLPMVVPEPEKAKHRSTLKPGCEHGGLEEDPAKPCHPCYMAKLKASDRFGLWAPVPQLTPARKRQAV